VSLERIKRAISDKTLRCPLCAKPILRFEKYVDLVASVWDGAGDSGVETGGCKVTLICGNEGCSWKERSEYWQNYLKE